MACRLQAWTSMVPKGAKKTPVSEGQRHIATKWLRSCIRSEGKKYTGVFSSENSSASTGKKQVWCIPKSLFSREKRRDREGKYIYTKEASRCLWGTPSRSIGV